MNLPTFEFASKLSYHDQYLIRHHDLVTQTIYIMDCRVRFFPIPRANPIPRNVVGLIGGMFGGDPTFVLSLNGKEIVVQAPTDPQSGALGRKVDFDESNPLYEWYINERALKIYAHYLEIIVCIYFSINRDQFG